jgi:hypothetical protein
MCGPGLQNLDKVKPTRYCVHTSAFLPCTTGWLVDLENNLTETLAGR